MAGPYFKYNRQGVTEDVFPEQYSRQAELLRISCILLIVCVHIPGPWQYNLDFSSKSHHYVYVFLNYGLARAAAPTLSTISGYLLFRGFTYKRYPRTIQRKFGTVLLPAVLWGSITACLVFVGQATGILQPKTFDLVGGDWRVWTDAVFGTDKGPIDLPLYFLYDLFVCFLITPLLFVMLQRRPWSGLLLLAVMWLSGLDEYLLVRGDILFGFYVGGLLAVRRVNLALSRRSAFLLIGVFLLACSAVAAFAMRIPPERLETDFNLAIDMVRVLGPVAMWAYATLVVNTRWGRMLTNFGGAAFFIFCFHGPILQVSGQLYFRWLGTMATEVYPLFYLVVPILVLASAPFTIAALRQASPPLLAVLSGGRLASIARGRAPPEAAAERLAKAPPREGGGKVEGPGFAASSLKGEGHEA